jgi:hypothetical protein
MDHGEKMYYWIFGSPIDAMRCPICRGALTHLIDTHSRIGVIDTLLSYYVCVHLPATTRLD